jgi:uncharacterized membrane protein
MDRNLQRKAQQRADRIAAFRAELAELEREQGLTLTAEQHSRLHAHLEGVLSMLSRQYGVDVTESAKRISWGMRLATLLGSVALFAAVVLFLQRIWGALPSAAHAPILVAIPLSLLTAAECAFRRGFDLYYTGLLALAAGVAFVMELDALGSIFNMAPSAHALLAWAAFAILVAYAYGLRLLLGAGLVLFCAYTASLWVAAGGGYWTSFLDRAGRLIPAAAALYFLPWLTARRDPHDFNFVYRLCGATTTLTALLILSERGDLGGSGLPARTLEALYQLAGLALSVGVAFHGLRLGRSGLVNLGAAAFVVFLFVRLQAWWWNWMPKYLFFLLIGLIALLLLFFFRRLRLRLSERAMP